MQAIKKYLLKQAPAVALAAVLAIGAPLLCFGEETSGRGAGGAQAAQTESAGTEGAGAGKKSEKAAGAEAAGTEGTAAGEKSESPSATGVSGENSREYLDAFLDALEEGDSEAAFSLVIPEYQEREAFDSGFSQLQEIWQGEGEYTAALLDTGTVEDKESGRTADAFLYEVKKGERTFQVSLAVETDEGGRTGVASFTMQRADKPVGTIDTFREFSPLQWLVLAIAAAEVLFTLFTLRDCLRKRPRLWGLWGFLIVMFYGGIQVMISQAGTNAGVFLRAFSPLKYLTYPGGEQYLILSLPLGAAIYWWVVGSRGGRRK